MAERHSARDVIVKRMMEGAPFDSEEVLAWMESSDVELQGAACDILMSKNAVVRGQFEQERVEAFIVDYHVARMKEAGKPVEARVFNTLPHIAAFTLALLYKQWFDEGPGRTTVDGLRRIRDELRKLYLEGDEEQKGCVVNGALEHIFENTACREDFTSWGCEPALASAIRAAAEWADRLAAAKGVVPTR